MDSEKEKNRLSDIVLERVGLTGNLLSAPVSPSLEPVVEIPSHGSQVRAGKVTGPEEYKRRFLVPAPRAAEWKTAYIDGRLHRRIAMLVRAAGCGSISGFIIRLLELHMEEHREDIASLLGEVYRPWDEDGQPGEPALSNPYGQVWEHASVLIRILELSVCGSVKISIR